MVYFLSGDIIVDDGKHVRGYLQVAPADFLRMKGVEFKEQRFLLRYIFHHQSLSLFFKGSFTYQS